MIDKYKECFTNSLSLGKDIDIEKLKYNEIPEWDSIGHMTLIAELEEKFEVSLETSRSLAEKIPDQFLKVSESGISEPNSIKELIKFGYKGFLIGENFMKSDHPGNTARDFIKKIT